MTIVRARVPARRARELLASALAAMLLLLAFSLPALGAPIGPTKLLAPTVEPRLTDTATPVTFSVTYRNAHALPPEYVRVAVAGTTFEMAGAGTDWKSGVAFTVSATIPAGTHGVRFEARDTERFVDALEAGELVVADAPAPTPPPATEPTPTPPPTDPPDSPAPLPTPTPPPPTGGTTAGGGTATGGGTTSGGGSGTADGTAGTGGSPTDREGPGDEPGPGSGPTGGLPAAGEAGTADGPVPGDSDPRLPWFSATGPAAGAAGGSLHGGGSIATESGSDGVSWFIAAADGGLAALGLAGEGGLPMLPTLPTLVGSTLLVSIWLAFSLFTRRRRDGEPPAPDGVLRAAAAMGVAIQSAPVPVAPVDPESLMPRWRRPSLIEARKTDPIRAPAPERPRLSFSIGDGAAGGARAVATATPAERRTVRYAVIQLLDGPDELRAARIGELVAGDEVQVQARSGQYCQILCPDGRAGWVHRTTLGDVIAVDRWSAGRGAGSGADGEPEAENALAALLAARGLHRA